MPNYQCNVQHLLREDEHGQHFADENLGCGEFFESKDDLGPRDRLCPKCRKKQD